MPLAPTAELSALSDAFGGGAGGDGGRGCDGGAGGGVGGDGGEKTPAHAHRRGLDYTRHLCHVCSAHENENKTCFPFVPAAEDKYTEEKEEEGWSTEANKVRAPFMHGRHAPRSLSLSLPLL